MKLLKVHSQYGKYAAQLDELFTYWAIADEIAANQSYQNDYFNDRADRCWAEYKAALDAVK